jgi:hypothetical protein
LSDVSWLETLREWIAKAHVVPLCRSCWIKRVKKREQGYATLYYLGHLDFEKCADCSKRIRRFDVIWVDD